MAEQILKTDNLNQGREKINVIIADTNSALEEVNQISADVAEINGQIDHRIKNKVINGNFKQGIDNWLYGNTDSTIIATNGVLSIIANGTSPSARPYQIIRNGMITGHKIYVKGDFKAKNSDVVRMGFALYRSGDPQAQLLRHQITYPNQNELYTISGIIDLPENINGDLSVSLRVEYFESAAATNKVVEVQKVIALDLTEIFGTGREPSAEEMDGLLGYYNGYFDDIAKLEDVVKAMVLNKVDRIDFNNLKTEVNERTFYSINELPVDRHKYDSNYYELYRFKTHDNSYNKQGASTDVNITFDGESTLSLISVNGADTFAYYDLGGTRDLSNADYIDFYVYIDNISNLDALQIDLMESTNLTVRFSQFYLKAEIDKVSDSGWRFVRIPKRMFVAANGTPEWSQIKNVRVFARGKVGSTVKVNPGKIDIVRVPRGAVYFYFDDATVSQYTNAFPIMDKYGLRGTVAVPTAKIGVNPDYMTWAQLRELYQAGWLITSHTHTERNLASLSETELRYEFETSSRMLFDRGFHFGSKCIVAPQGSWSPFVDSIAREYFSLCRTNVYSGTEREALPSSEFIQSHPRYKKYVSPYDYDSPDLLKSWIDNVIAKKEEVSIAWHIIQTPAPNQWSNSVEVFEEVIAYARQKMDEGVLNVLTWMDSMPQVQQMNPIDDEGNQYLISVNGKPTVLTLPIRGR